MNRQQNAAEALERLEAELRKWRDWLLSPAAVPLIQPKYVAQKIDRLLEVHDAD